MDVTYVDHMGSDLRVVDAARVSFNKESKWETDLTIAGPVNKRLSKGDTKLVNYLASHNHWTPFAHCQLTIRVKAPIFVARQLFKHKIGITENEISRRYVDDAPEFFVPDVWRGKPTNKKQGSSDEEIQLEEVLYSVRGDDWAKKGTYYDEAIDKCKEAYQDLLKAGVAPEQARMVLPQGMYTEWYWTGSLSAFARVYGLRWAPDAQEETKFIAGKIGEICKRHFPTSWFVLSGQKTFEDRLKEVYIW